MQLDNLRQELRGHINHEKAEFLPYFFKTGPGQYGEGDRFLGVVVPDIRKTARAFQGIPLEEVVELLRSQWHEERMCALLILADKYKQATNNDNGHEDERRIFDLYLSNTEYINNWDLVDLTAPDIVGRYVYEHPAEQKTLFKLAKSVHLFERRISVISTFWFVKLGEPEPTLTIVESLLGDKEDLMHKATGWMLREVYKRVDEGVVEQFLRTHYARLPRTALRYAIEKMPEPKRQAFLRGEF
ncbi:MAG: DNA alkylation repair protein [Candidatus Nomurabacteria bacterium]|jgi:3-methyladenine DNA glycosylase AlkD|nr:DNA alkylation repair protein [Candidatus Nomurabacteria bacterium]